MVSEVAVRYLWANPSPPLFTVTEGEFVRVPGIFRPNQRVELQPGTRFANTVAIDSLGYRGPHIPRAKPPAELRVLFVGDSFTWGHNVADDETLPSQLEQRLMGRCGAARVVNAGLSGSTILGQQAMVERGLTLNPDLVVLMFHENDIDEILHLRTWDRLAENRRIKSRFPVSVVYPVLSRSRLWSLAQHLRRVRQERVAPTVEQGGREIGPDERGAVEEARAEYAARLREVARLLEGRGVPLLFVAFPHPNSVMEGAGGPHYAWVLETADGIEIPSVDLLGPLAGSGVPVEEAFLLPEDYHPSPRGHGIAADELADAIAGGSFASRCLPGTS
jgi:lysophospholipase L1-like esterase